MPSSSRPCRMKLRTKKGCVKCRERKKKCDERKPTCAACARLGFSCDWPDMAALVDRRERCALNSRWSSGLQACYFIPHHSTALISKSSMTEAYLKTDPTAPDSRFPGFSSGILYTAQNFSRSNREVLLQTYYYESYIPANILPKAHTDFSKAYVVDIPELKDVMYACSSMQWANRYDISPVEALYYHARAISGLRRRLESAKVTGLEDWLLAITILLHTFETWRFVSDRSAPSVLQHLIGATQLLKLRCTSILPEEQHKFNVLIAESVLFHISTLLASGISSATITIDSTVWDWVEIIFKRPAYNNVFPPANHPVLGTPRKLNRLVFEISQLSMRTPLTADDMLVAEMLGAELHKWEVNNEHETLDDGIYLRQDPYIDVRKLYIVCARIVLLLIVATDLTANISVLESQLESERSKGMSILSSMEDTNDDLWNFLMRWPLFILGHTVETDEEKRTIRTSLERIWQKSSCGDVKWCLKKIQCLWKERSSERNSFQILKCLNYRDNA